MMKHRTTLAPFAWTAVYALTAWISACDGREQGGSAGPDAAAGSGVDARADGAQVHAGDAGRADGFDPADYAEYYTCQANRVDPDPGGDSGEGEACCGRSGTCVAASDADPTLAASLGHETCESTAGLLCSPKPELFERELLESCRALGPLDAEGRCLPACFLLGETFAAFLDRDSCAADSLCAPCVNPLDGSSTGACELENAAGQVDAPAEEATVLTPCGQGSGACIPMSGVEDERLNMLPRAGCAAGEACAPTGSLAPGSCLTPCDTGLAFMGGPESTPGACVPRYVLSGIVGFGAAMLRPSTCAGGEVCAPCINPLDGVVTGACSL